MLPKSTLRSWVIGQPYTTKGGERFFAPLIQIADRDASMMSFMDLVEAHVLSALRRQHRVKLETIREAVRRIRERTADAPSPPLSPSHPLADHQFATIGVTLFVEELGRLVNLSQNNQLGLRECLEGYLKRIDREPSTGTAARLYPFTRAHVTLDSPRTVVIDPRIAFGRPVIAGTNIKTELVAERFWAGESPEDLSGDYDVSISAITEALRWEHRPAA
jgi:uncharacterized protein (DUF433 family)